MATIGEIIACGSKSLPRSLDVQINVNKPQVEGETDLSTTVFVTDSGPLRHGPGRIRYYQNLASLAEDFNSTTEAWKAGRDFFAQAKARTLAVAQAFSTPQPGFLATGAVGTVAAFQAVTDGSFTIAIDGVSEDITALNFSTDTTLAQIATRIQTALQAVASGGFTAATVAVSGTQFVITSGTSGDGSTVSVLAPVSPASGTDISGAGFLNGQAGTAVSQIGYTPTTFTNELDLISSAADCSGRFVYAWILDEVYRDAQQTEDMAAWAETRRAIFFPVSNNPLAWDPASTTDIGPELQLLGYTRTVAPIYHDNAEYYPDAALAAIMLGVNYSLPNSATTAKFANLIGIPTVGLTVSQWTTLQSKGYNTFSLTGNNARVFREGEQVAASWYIDDRINLDNYAEELETEIYNAFLQNGGGNGKLPMNVSGHAVISDRCELISRRYEVNGTFSARRVADATQMSGFREEPAYQIIQSDIGLLTSSDRANRIGAPIQINVNLAGAIHSIAVEVNAFS